MIRKTLVVVCLFIGLLTTAAWAEEAPATPELPELAVEAAPEAAPALDLEETTSQESLFTSAVSGSGHEGCSTVGPQCRQDCCYEYFDCFHACNFNIPCIVACDQADQICLDAC